MSPRGRYSKKLNQFGDDRFRIFRKIPANDKKTSIVTIILNMTGGAKIFLYFIKNLLVTMRDFIKSV